MNASRRLWGVGETRGSGTRSSRTAAVALAALLVVPGIFVAAGCSRYVEDEWSRQWPRRVPAGGIVEYQGKPVGDATVVFVATGEGGKEYAATGVTDAAGRFRLRTFRDSDGAIVGEHRVQIEKWARVAGKPVRGLSEADQPMVEKNVLPAKYKAYASSGLTAKVTEKGPNTFTFQLEDSGPVMKPAP